MILEFLLVAALMLIIASFIFVFPFVFSKKGYKNANRTARNKLNRALYDTRLDELESDEEQGIVIEKKKMVAELQHSLLDDINDVQHSKESKANNLLWLPGLLVLMIGSASLYYSVGGYRQVDNWQGVLQGYPALQNKLFNESQHPPSEQELRDIMLGLRTHLSRQADDADGWLLYGRLAMVFRDAQSALKAVNKAYALNPASIAIRLAYIQLKLQGDETAQREAEVILSNLLKAQPDLLEAWSIYAFIALEKQDFSLAIARWQIMQALVDADSEQASVLRDSIAYARKRLDSVQDSEHLTLSEQGERKGTVSPVGETYQVQITTTSEVSIPENGFLFVFAQAAAGSAMPIAALKIPLTGFPISVELSDANSMTAGIKLSDYPEFIIKARISLDGSITSGSWQGQTQLIKAGENKNIKLLISQPL